MEVGYPTWKKYKCMQATVSRMTVREKRQIFAMLRTDGRSADMLLTQYGMTLGDFCCMNILGDTASRR